MTEKERYQLLESKGIILSDNFQQRLIDLGVINFKGEYYLEDILKFIPLIHQSWCFKMLYDCRKNPTVLIDNGSLPSEESRSVGTTFVNAAGEFLINAIERGVVSSSWKEFLVRGLQVSEYQCRSNLLSGERNWIKDTFTKMIREKSLWHLFKIKLFR